MLQRRPQESGTTFADLLDEVRAVSTKSDGMDERSQVLPLVAPRARLPKRTIYRLDLARRFPKRAGSSVRTQWLHTDRHLRVNRLAHGVRRRACRRDLLRGRGNRGPSHQPRPPLLFQRRPGGSLLQLQQGPRAANLTPAALLLRRHELLEHGFAQQVGGQESLAQDEIVKLPLLELRAERRLDLLAQ